MHVVSSRVLAGLACAGYCLSPLFWAAFPGVAGDKTSHAAMRNMMACTVTGQGAGVAAAISLKLNVNTSEVAIQAVQAELHRQGVKLD